MKLIFKPTIASIRHCWTSCPNAIGQNTFQFLVQFVVMLYLLFFLLRDGMPLARLLRTSAPLAPGHTRYLLQKFGFSLSPIILGFILESVIETNLIRGLMFSKGDFTAFVTNPISAIFFVIALLSAFFSIRKELQQRKKRA